MHFGTPGDGPVLREGMFFTIEPMINAGRYDVKILDDGWTAVTRDGSLAAHFEHTVAVTDAGPRVLSQMMEADAAADVMTREPALLPHG